MPLGGPAAKPTCPCPSQDVEGPSPVLQPLMQFGPNADAYSEQTERHTETTFTYLLFKAQFVCVRACISVCYTNLQFSTDLDQNWYEASLRAGAEQGQVADAFGRSAQHPLI